MRFGSTYNIACINRIILFIFSVLFLTLSCEPETDSWQYAGTESVYIDSIAAPEDIYASETLVVKLWSRKISRDKFDSLEFVLSRDSSKAEISAYVTVYNWRGNSIIPPTNPFPLHATEYAIDSPFKTDTFRVIAKRPDSTEI